MGMSIDEAITRYKNNAEYERTHDNLQGCLEFRQLAKWLEELRAYRNMYHADNVDNCLREKELENRMTIEEKAIKTLNEIIDEGWLISDMEKCTAIDACEFAIDRIHKYQKIERILYNGFGKGVYAVFDEIVKVVKNGNDGN